MHDLVPGFVLDAVRELHSDQVCSLVAGGVKRPIQPLIANGQTVDVIEGAQNVFAGAKPESAEEDRTQELALAVDTDVEHILLVVFELYPGSTVGNDLAQEVRAIVGGFEEHAGRAVQLADDHALGAVHDEGAVVGHQRNVAEEDFLLLDVADGAVAGLGILLINGQPHGDLQRGGVGHTALFALVDVVFQLQADRIAALVAEVRCVGVVSAALVAEHVAGVEWVGDDRGSAVLAGSPQVMQAFKVAALAFPVADGVVHELQLRDVAEVRNREHGLKHRLQSAIITLAG